MSEDDKIKIEQIDENLESDKFPESPINIDVTKSITKNFPPLVWTNFDKIATKMKITNSGQTRKKVYD